MTTITNIQQLNRELAEQLNDDTLRNPQSPDAGKFVGIANGKVVVIADNWDEVVDKLDQMEADPAKTLCIELGRDYKTPQEIWEVTVRAEIPIGVGYTE